MKKAKTILFYCVLIYCCIVGGLYIAQRDMIYFPQKTAPNSTTFKALGIKDFTTQTADGLSLTAWYSKAKQGLPTILLFHGNASTHAMSSYKMAGLIQEGYGFLSAGYRGYNGNEGKPSEEGFYKDARAWMNFLKEQNVSADQIILYGESIGTGVAVQTALENPGVKMLVLESPYTSLPDVAASMYFFLPVRLLMNDKFDNLSKIKQIETPLLIFQGMRDKVISPKLGQRLYAYANDPKKLIQFDDARHNDMPITAMTDAIKAFQ